MARNNSFSVHNSLVWKFEKPFMDAARQSPNFSFLGNVWYFCFTYNTKPYERGYYYFLTLDRKDKEIELKAFKVVVFVKDGHNRIITPFTHFSTSSKIVTEFADSFHNSSTHGKWTLYCIFFSKGTIQLHDNRSETMYLSSMPDSSLNKELNPTQSSTFMKAKLAACAPYDDPSGLESLSCDLNKLLEKKSSTDVTLKCEDKTFSAHRSILSARSSVFAAMFEKQMVENKTGIVDITDIDGHIFDMLLKYVYSGTVPDLNARNASSLYAAADKYAIQILKSECSKWMLANLSTDNCLDFLLLADSCSDNRFKDRLVTFTAEILDLFDEQLWLKFTEEYPKLAVSVYQMRVYPNRSNKSSKV